MRTLRLGLDDRAAALRERYLGSAHKAVYLIRPDQHVAARWTGYDQAAIKASITTATGGG